MDQQPVNPQSEDQGSKRFSLSRRVSHYLYVMVAGAFLFGGGGITFAIPTTKAAIFGLMLAVGGAVSLLVEVKQLIDFAGAKQDELIAAREKIAALEDKGTTSENSNR